MNQAQVTMSNHEYTIEDLKGWAAIALKFAQRDFKKNPNAVHWMITTRAMFVFQQVDYAMRMPYFDQQALLESLQGEPYLKWEDLISVATTGMNVRDALKTFA